MQAQSEGLPISLEVTAHHLFFSSDDVPAGGTQFKCAPPLRSRANQEALQKAVSDGNITVISSDHSPSLARLKQLESGDFLSAWGGISGQQYLLPAVNTIGRVRSLLIL
jgi:allantoinase